MWDPLGFSVLFMISRLPQLEMEGIITTTAGKHLILVYAGTSGLRDFTEPSFPYLLDSSSSHIFWLAFTVSFSILRTGTLWFFSFFSRTHFKSAAHHVLFNLFFLNAGLLFIISFFGIEVYLIPIALVCAQALVLILTLAFEIDIQTYFFPRFFTSQIKYWHKIYIYSATP